MHFDLEAVKISTMKQGGAGLIGPSCISEKFKHQDHRAVYPQNSESVFFLTYLFMHCGLKANGLVL